jgi:hypothetical protein
MAKRFTTSSHHDPTITQKVRTALYDGGHADLVNEIIIDGMRDVEQMARGGLADHEKRLLMLEEAERDRLTKTTVLELIRIKDANETVAWVKWGKRAILGGIGTAVLGGIGWVLSLAWKGLHT